MENAKKIVNVSGLCFDHVQASSNGIWNVKPGESILQHPLVRFHVQLILMFSLANFFNFFLRRLHFPRITSEFLAGMILGKTAIRKFLTGASMLLFPPIPTPQAVDSLAKVGYVMLIFLAAVKMDPRLVKRTGSKAVILAVVVFAVQRTMVQTIQLKFDPTYKIIPSAMSQSLTNTRTYFVALCTTQFVGVSSVLMELRLTNSRLGHMSLATALVSEIFKIVGTNLMQYVFYITQVSVRVAVQAAFFTFTLVLFIVIILRAMIVFFIKRTPEGKPIKPIYATIVVGMVFVVSSLGDTTGTSYLFGPIILGLVVPAGSPLASSLIAKLETLTTGFLIPLLTMYVGTTFDLWEFFSKFDELLHFHITFFAYAIKLAITFITALCLKQPWKEAAALTLILNIKGVVDLGYFLSFSDVQVGFIQTTCEVFLIVLLATAAPPFVKLLYNPDKQYIGHKKMSIQHSSADQELQILACAHRQDDAMAAIKLLEFSNPTKTSPLSIYGLCLEELVSSATPLLINHQLGQVGSSTKKSHSQPIIEIFKYFKSQNKKSVNVSLYTAISPLPQMHEDICWLAFDRGSSFIILPFHKKWNSKGKLVSSSNELRTVNISVLDRAPCSVSILIDRGRNRGLSSIFVTSAVYRVAVLFIGGADDREALAYGLRMAGSPRVELTIIHFGSPFDSMHDRWEKMLNVESLRSMKHQMSKSTNIHYMEETVRDGSDTASILHSMEGRYDLIMVGRRHETEPEALTGLSQWTELPELGPLGDLLASDTTSEVSVLVVQQQIMKQSHSSILN